MRVTASEVKAIVPTDIDDSVVDIWITSANAVVNSVTDCIGGGEDLLKQVELMLSAHFVAMLSSDTRLTTTKEKLDTFETSYANPAKMQELIDSTPWGANANMLANGCLTNISQKAATVEFF